MGCERAREGRAIYATASKHKAAENPLPPLDKKGKKTKMERVILVSREEDSLNNKE